MQIEARKPRVKGPDEWFTSCCDPEPISATSVERDQQPHRSHVCAQKRPSPLAASRPPSLTEGES